MNNIVHLPPRERGRTLLIVEGNHEKNELFKTLFKCFPEMGITEEDVWIYGTNIYCLYDSLVGEYGEDWEEEDINLPLLVSRERQDIPAAHKDDFQNIILVFDYERHDPRFSKYKIEKLQAYFSDTTEMGKLYINYPMIESYQDLQSLPDADYKNRYALSSMDSGAVYKSHVRDSFMAIAMGFPGKLKSYLESRCSCSAIDAEQLTEAILGLQRKDALPAAIADILQEKMSPACSRMSKNYISHLIHGLQYMGESCSYWQYMRYLFQEIIKHNIYKCSMILSYTYELENDAIRAMLDRVDFNAILVRQNLLSDDQSTGRIWILNTCVLLIAEYDQRLIWNVV